MLCAHACRPSAACHAALPQVEKEKEALRMELNKSKQQIKEADTAISSQRAEIEKLNHIINEADQERIRQKKEYDIVVNERDILGTQLIRRNDELALLYEKIKIQQSTLSKGQIQYRDRLNELRVLKIKLNDLKRELHILKSSVSNIDVLKREVHQLGRELLQERTKVKALSEELENPLNVHRCVRARAVAWHGMAPPAHGAHRMRWRSMGAWLDVWLGAAWHACRPMDLRMWACSSRARSWCSMHAPVKRHAAPRSAPTIACSAPLSMRPCSRPHHAALLACPPRRWRKLEGSDPGTYEMIQKIQTLQKRLIAKTEEVVEKDLLIQEKEKLYMELKNILARQPGPEVAEQLSIYQANLREKTKQMKAMASELNMYQAQVNEYKYEIERLVRELNEMKRKYFETKRREQMDRERGGKPVMPPPPNPNQPRFTGGGFSLSQ